MAAEKTKAKVGGLSGNKAVVIVHKDSNKGAIDPVPVALEGVQYTIKRGAEVTIPVELVPVLEHASETQFASVMNKDMSTTMEPREVLSYPFSVIRLL